MNHRIVDYKEDLTELANFLAPHILKHLPLEPEPSPQVTNFLAHPFTYYELIQFLYIPDTPFLKTHRAQPIVHFISAASYLGQQYDMSPSTRYCLAYEFFHLSARCLLEYSQDPLISLIASIKVNKETSTAINELNLKTLIPFKDLKNLVKISSQ